MKREERVIYWGLIVALFFFMFKSCERPVEWEEKTKTSRTVEHRTYWDTIEFPVKKEVLVYVKVPVPFNEEPDPVDSSIIREYSSPYEDSLIKGNINIKVDGTLLAQSLLYTPKFPKYIIKTDSVIVTNTIEKTLIEQPKTRLLIGASVLGSKNNVGIVPSLGIMDKKYTSYMIGYDVVNKTVNVTFIKPIRLKRK